MFDITDKEMIMNIINQKKPDMIVIPLYVKVFNRIYGITELDNIMDFSKFSFKIGFGAMNQSYKSTKSNFPMNQLQCFYDPRLYHYFDEENQFKTDYVVFESDKIDVTTNGISKEIIEEINRYFDMLSDYIDTRVTKMKKERIKEMIEQYQ